MSILFSLLALQAGSVPERSPELDAANDCLVANTQQWLEDRADAPDDAKRWTWAQVIVARCDEKLAASVPARPSEKSVLMELQRDGAAVNIPRHQLIRSEAMYYVDGMIRAHLESAAK